MTDCRNCFWQFKGCIGHLCTDCRHKRDDGSCLCINSVRIESDDCPYYEHHDACDDCVRNSLVDTCVECEGCDHGPCEFDCIACVESGNYKHREVKDEID